MKYEKGSALVIAMVAILALIAGVVLIAVMSYIAANNDGVRMEAAIKAQYEQNKNVLAQYGQKIAEAAQVPAMARDDLTKVVTAAIEGRYGDKGSQAAFQWIQEQNPSTDPELYRKIQQLIESGRDEFKNSQARLVDLKRNYETQLGFFWKGLWLKLAGYPKIKMDDYKVVTTSRAEAAFETGQEAPIKLR